MKGQKILVMTFILISIRGIFPQNNWELLFEKKAIAHINRMAVNDSELLIKRVNDHKFIKSTDLGVTWFDASLNNPTDLIDSKAFDSYDDLVVYNNSTSAFFSTDFGSTWEIIPGTDSISVFYTICIADSQTIFIGANSGVFKYYLGSSSIIDVNNGLDSTSAVYIGKSNLNEVFCQLENKKIYFSSDEGNSWVRRVLFHDGFIDSHIAFDETKLIISIEENLYLTSNSGVSWIYLPSPHNFNLIRGFTYVSNRLFCATSHEIFSTSDLGQNWIYEIDVDEPVAIKKSNSNGIIVASEKSGILRKLNGSSKWDTVLVDGTLPTSISKVKTHGGKDIFAGTINRGLFISTNTGIDWEYSGFEGPGKSIKNIEFDSDNNVYVLCNQLYFSSDNGISWELRSPLDNQNPFTYEIFGDFKIVEETGEIIAATKNGDFYITYDKGVTWSRIYSFQWFPSPSINNIIVINGTIYLASVTQHAGFNMFFYLMKSTDGCNWYNVLDGGFYYIFQHIGESNILAANLFNVYRSDNFGDTWEEINFDKRVLCFLLKGSENIFAGTFENGVYISNDEGFNWSQLNLNGLTNKKINSLDYLEEDYLLAATDHGIFRTKALLTNIKVEEAPIVNFQLSQNYPNPFNPVTKIKYAIPSGVEGLTSLKVYDLLGREVVTLVNKPMTAGTYEVEFNGSNLPSGVYFYKFTAGKFSDTKKLLLLK